MQAIITTYHGPTNTRGSRITAKCAAGSVSVGYDHALNIDGNHCAAAQALRAKLGWDKGRHGNLVAGYLPSGGYAHVFVK
jgi:hypothetical protein